MDDRKKRAGQRCLTVGRVGGARGGGKKVGTARILRRQESLVFRENIDTRIHYGAPFDY